MRSVYIVWTVDMLYIYGSVLYVSMELDFILGTVPRYYTRYTLIIRGLELGTMESGNYHRGSV